MENLDVFVVEYLMNKTQNAHEKVDKRKNCFHHYHKAPTGKITSPLPRRQKMLPKRTYH